MSNPLPINISLDPSLLKNMDEDDIKKKIMSCNTDANMMDLFKAYLEDLIKRKLQHCGAPEEKSLQQTLAEYKEKKIEEKLNKKLENVRDKSTKKGKVNTFENKLYTEADLYEERKEIIKAQTVLETSKKLKNRMKIVKIDKAEKFYRQKIQTFKNLDTFIDAKEFFEGFNPYKEKLDKKVQKNPLKQLSTVRKIQKESAAYFDKRIKEFNDRMDELNNENTKMDQKIDNKVEEQEKSVEESDSSSNSSKSSSSEQKNLEIKKNSKLLPSLPLISNMKNIKKSSSITMGNNNSIFKDNIAVNFNDNINFLKNQSELNKSVIDVFKEFYDPKGLIKKSRTRVTDGEKLRKDIYKYLMKTEAIISEKIDIEKEEKDDPIILFYEKNLKELKDENKKAIRNIKKKEEEDELKALLRLEKIIEDMAQDKNKTNNRNSNDDINKKLFDYKNSSGKILKLIDKTSRKIFNEKHKTIHDKVSEHVKSYKRRSLGVFSFKKFDNLDFGKKNGLYITSLDSEETEDKSTLQNNGLNLMSLNIHKKASSLSLPTQSFLSNSKGSVHFNNIIINDSARNRQNSLTKIEIPKTYRDNIIKEENEIVKNSFPLSTRNYFRSATIKSLVTPRLKEQFDPLKYKNKNYLIDEIIKKTENVQEKFKKEEDKLKSLEVNWTKFYEDTKFRVNPPLESIILTLDKPNHNDFMKKKNIDFKSIRKGKLVIL